VGGGRGQGAWWAFGPLWSVGQVQNKIMVLNFHVNYKRRQPTTAKKRKKGRVAEWVGKAKKLAIINDPPAAGKIPHPWKATQ